MTKARLYAWLVPVVLLMMLASLQCGAQTLKTDAERITDLEVKVQNLGQKVGKVEAGGLGFLAASFCALWAQQTRRNAWVWFFMGAIFNVIAILVLLYKNSEDLKRARRVG